MKARINELRPLLRSFLRIFPSALIGFIPMSGLDTLMLQASYSIRGERSLPSQMQVIKVDPKFASEYVPNALKKYQPKNCVLIHLKPVRDHYCHSINLNEYFSLNSLLDTHRIFQPWFQPDNSKINDNYEPYYYGPISNKISTWTPQSLNSTIPEEISLLVFLATDPLPPFIFETPAGKLSSPDIILNVLGNFIDSSGLKRGSYQLQIAITFGLFIGFAIFLSQFPIWLSGVVLTGSLFFYYLISLIMLDQFQFAIPIAAPISALILCYILSMTDKLDRREKLQWSLERETEFLREIDELKNHFLSLVSHDLKTPIARIQSLLEQLLFTSRPKDLTPEQNSLIEKALRANSQLQRSIGTLLLLNRIESRDFKIQRRPTDMSHLIKDALVSPRELAQERKIEIVTELEPLFLADLDSSLIREVIYNLVDNAIKYSPNNSKIIVRCGENSVLSELTPPQAGIWFEIQDSGPGIDPKDRIKVIERFYTTDSKKIPAAQAIKGTGLGLYLSTFFVEKHGGCMTLISKCPNENLTADDPALEYFPNSQHGTLVRVALPLDNLYIGNAS